MTTVLIVDDSPFARAMLVDQLAGENYEILQAGDGREALEIIENQHVDIVLLDIVMPGMDGYEVCKKIKSNDDLGFVPVCLVTSKSDTKDIVHGLEVGADEYISKPPQKEELLARMKVLLRLKQLRDLLYESNENLKKLNSELDFRVQQKTEQLQQQNEELMRLEKLKSDFLANTSHELRTPLNAIIGYAEILLEGILGEVNDKQSERIQKILSNGQHLLKMINELLDLAKAKAGRLRMNIEKCNYTNVIRESVSMVQGLLDNKNIDIDYVFEAQNLPCEIDEGRIRQVIINILSNAIKFSDPETKIKIVVKDIDWAWYTAISDQGIGIPKQEQVNLFEEFRQVEGRGDEKKGTGLGLPITKQIIELHGGEIWFESEEGEGTTFFFVLPKKHSDLKKFMGEDLKNQSETENDPVEVKKSILFIEDSKEIIDSIMMTMVADEYESNFAKSQDAKEHLMNNEYDYVLMNMSLKNVSSFILLYELKEYDNIILYSINKVKENDLIVLENNFGIKSIVHNVLPESLGKELKKTLNSK